MIESPRSNFSGSIKTYRVRQFRELVRRWGTDAARLRTIRMRVYILYDSETTAVRMVSTIRAGDCGWRFSESIPCGIVDDEKGSQWEMVNSA